MSKKTTVMLPPEVAEKYQLVNYRGSARQFYGSKLGYIDVSTLTLQAAERLVSLGFRYLKEKPPKAAKKDEQPKPEK